MVPRRCRMEMGDFMAPGQHVLDRVEHRGAVKVFGVSSLWGVSASRMGQIVSTAYQERVAFSLCVFFKSLHWVVFSALHCQDTQAVCIVCVSSLNSFQVSGCDLCVSFLRSTFWFSCLWFSFWWKQVFVPHLSFARDKIYRFCKKWDAGGKKTPQNTPLLPPNPIGGTM